MTPRTTPPARTLRRGAASAAVALLAALAVAPRPADAQSFADRLKRKAEEAATRAAEARVAARAGAATNAAIDAAESGGEGSGQRGATNAAAGSTAPGGAGPTAQAPARAAAAPAAAPASAPALRPGEGAWANYDFVPGARLLFADDFARDRVGDFPRQLEFAAGNMDVVEWQGARWLRVAPPAGKLAIPLPERLPERFTVEFEYAGMHKYELVMAFTDGRVGGAAPTRVKIGAWGAGVDGGGVTALTRPADAAAAGVARVRVMADGRYVKVYVDAERVANVPNASLGRATKIWLAIPAPGDGHALVRDLRVAAGGLDLYDAIAARGRVATRGIYFDTGSDALRPESTPTLRAIADMLAAHPGLALTIEGHTDDTGDAAANRALSERRAAAVLRSLGTDFGADASRLSAAGVGAARPVAPNATATGRQANRRVELVRR